MNQLSNSTALTFPQTIDSSMRAEFVACPHSFFRRYVQGLSKAGDSVHLHFGAVFAAGLAEFREAFWLRGDTVDQALAAGMQTILTKWGDVEFAHPAKTLDRCLGALEAYVSHYPPATDHLTPLVTDGKIFTEFNFALPLPILHPETGEPLLYSGRFDMLGMLQGSTKVVEDDKTTSQLGASWGEQWRLRAQFTGYAWGAEEYGHQIGGVVVRGISILKTMYGHAEIIEQRPKWMIRKWQTQLHRDINRMVELWREADFLSAERRPEVWDQNLSDSCSAFGGCQFLTLCTSEHPDRWLGDYEVRHYDPLNVQD